MGDGGNGGSELLEERRKGRGEEGREGREKGRTIKCVRGRETIEVGKPREQER